REWRGGLHNKKKNGELFWELASISPVFDDRGNITEFVAVKEDITERKRNEELLARRAEELSRSNLELQQFAYIASHALQEPLRTVSGFVQRLAQRYQGRLDEKADQYIGFAVEGCRRMQQLIEDLLLYSRVTTWGRLPEPVDGGTVLARTLGD